MTLHPHGLRDIFCLTATVSCTVWVCFLIRLWLWPKIVASICIHSFSGAGIYIGGSRGWSQGGRSVGVLNFGLGVCRLGSAGSRGARSRGAKLSRAGFGAGLGSAGC